MKKYLLLLICSLCALFARTQETVNRNAMVLRLDSILVTDAALVQIRTKQLAEGKTATADFMKRIEQKVTETLVAAAGASRRFDVTDIALAEKMDAELRTELAMELNDADRRKLLKDVAEKTFAADWILQANITHCQFTRKGDYGWTCILHVTPIIRDRRDETKRIIDSRPFVSDIKNMAIKTEREDAIATALETMQEPLTAYFTNNFPVYAKIMRLTEKNDAEINCGIQHRVAEGDEFQVESVEYRKDDDGKLQKLEAVIGTIKVKQVRDQSAICDLRSGKEKIMDINSKGGYLKCKMIMK